MRDATQWQAYFDELFPEGAYAVFAHPDFFEKRDAVMPRLHISHVNADGVPSVMFVDMVIQRQHFFDAISMQEEGGTLVFENRDGTTLTVSPDLTQRHRDLLPR